MFPFTCYMLNPRNLSVHVFGLELSFHIWNTSLPRVAGNAGSARLEGAVQSSTVPRSRPKSPRAIVSPCLGTDIETRNNKQVQPYMKENPIISKAFSLTEFSLINLKNKMRVIKEAWKRWIYTYLICKKTHFLFKWQ